MTTHTNAFLFCTRSVLGGRLLSIENASEGNRVFSLLAQNRIDDGALWTAGLRSGPESWFWYHGTDEPSIDLPNDSPFWGEDEPRTELEYNSVVYMKSEFGYDLRSYPRYGVVEFRYICEIMSDETLE